MPDGFITATPGTGTNVETTQLARTDGTVVQRERVVIGDNANVNQFMDVDTVLQARRAAEAQTLWLRDQAALAASAARFCARMPLSDNRGRFDRGYR